MQPMKTLKLVSKGVALLQDQYLVPDIFLKFKNCQIKSTSVPNSNEVSCSPLINVMLFIT